MKLLDALNHALDDMGEDGHCVCPATKQAMQEASEREESQTVEPVYSEAGDPSLFTECYVAMAKAMALLDADLGHGSALNALATARVKLEQRHDRLVTHLAPPPSAERKALIAALLRCYRINTTRYTRDEGSPSWEPLKQAADMLAADAQEPDDLTIAYMVGHANGKRAQQVAAKSSLPEWDNTKSNRQQGLFQKFIVQRVDGSDAPGNKHAGCEYFVLDATHDQHAPAALRAYAESCAATHPQLSADLASRWGTQQVAVPQGLLSAFDTYASQFTFKGHPAEPKHFQKSFPWFEAGYKAALEEAMEACKQADLKAEAKGERRTLTAANHIIGSLR